MHLCSGEMHRPGHAVVFLFSHASPELQVNTAATVSKSSGKWVFPLQISIQQTVKGDSAQAGRPFTGAS